MQTIPQSVCTYILFTSAVSYPIYVVSIYDLWYNTEKKWEWSEDNAGLNIHSPFIHCCICIQFGFNPHIYILYVLL